MQIKNIIFDIGNVIIDIDYQKAIEAFQQLSSGIDFSKLVTLTQQTDLFNHFEKGLISAEEFIQSLKKYLQKDVQDEAIIKAWNALLIHYPTERFQLLEKLKANYSLFALSNINPIHLDEIDKQVNRLFQKKNLASYFDKAYYSHEVGFRKPEKEIYELVIHEQKIIPEQTLFIDDKLENILPAEKLGFKTHHLQKAHMLLFWFEKSGFII